MAIARMHGGPLDGQVLPLEDIEQDSFVVPYAQTQVIYRRTGEPRNTGDHDGPTEVDYAFTGAEDDLVGETGDSAE